MRVYRELLWGLSKPDRLFTVPLLLMLGRPPIVEANEVGGRNQGRVLQFGLDGRRGPGFNRFRLNRRELRALGVWGDSIVELISGFTVAKHLRQETKGADNHARRTELLTAGMLFALIPIIGLGAIYSYASGLRTEGSPLGIVIALGAVIIVPCLWWQKRKIGEETRGLPLSIDAVE